MRLISIIFKNISNIIKNKKDNLIRGIIIKYKILNAHFVVVWNLKYNFQNNNYFKKWKNYIILISFLISGEYKFLTFKLNQITSSPLYK